MNCAMSVGGSHNCTTTVLALTLGPANDPEVSSRVDGVRQWFHFWNKSINRHDDIRSVWPKIVNKLVDSLAPWSQVTSLVSNTILTLLQIGIYPLRPDYWIVSEKAGGLTGFHFPLDGQTFSVISVRRISQFLQVFTAAHQSRLWSKAALHRNGKGLEQGTDIRSVTAYYDYLRKKR